MKAVFISNHFLTWSVHSTIRACRQLFKVGFAEYRVDLALVLGNENSLQGFMILGQTDSTVKYVVYCRQRVEAFNLWEDGLWLLQLYCRIKRQYQLIQRFLCRSWGTRREFALYDIYDRSVRRSRFSALCTELGCCWVCSLGRYVMSLQPKHGGDMERRFI